jgi:hypothetical protein
MLAGGLVALVPTASASPAGPVTNSNFEIPPVPDEASQALAGTPVDECYGVGHQAFYGEESPQGQIAGSDFNPYALQNAEPVNPDESSPSEAVTQVSEDPEGVQQQQTDCVYSVEDGRDVAWVQPKDRSTQPFHWSMDVRNPSADFGFNFDDDPFDREVKLLADENLAHHNLWQWFGSKHQAYTPNADAFSMDLEEGDVSGQVKLVLTSNPLHEAEVAYYDDCSLTFTASTLADHVDENGHIAVDPVDADFSSRRAPCDALATQWENAENDEQRRDVLSQTRITQLSFWGWEGGTSEDSVIDNVELPGANTAAEAAAGVDAPLN